MVGKAIYIQDHFEWTIFNEEGKRIPYSLLYNVDDGGEMSMWSDHCINHFREMKKASKN